MEKGSEITEIRIIKLGGACITDKQKFETLNKEMLNTLLTQISLLKQEKPNCYIILIHGAGSFGHSIVKKYSIHLNKENEPFSLIGFSETRQSLRKLQSFIVDSLLEKKIPALSISAFPNWKTKNKTEIISDELELIAELLIEGFLPVLHGDVIIDTITGCSVLSGDTIIKHIACNIDKLIKLMNEILIKKGKKKINNEIIKKNCSVIFITNVDGIFTLPPEIEGAKLIQDLKVNKSKEINFLEMNKLELDVSGGIKTKIEEALDIALNEIDVFIVKGGTEYSFQAIKGEKPKLGTYIHN